MAKSKVQGRISKKNFIELTGKFGTFRLPKKEVQVNYFSTSAGGRATGNHSFEFLKELKPMRDRIKASELKNLDSLLQRDLNDFRVVNDLIPYLLDARPSVAFFPAILCILIPKGFLSEKGCAPYPMERESEGEGTSIVEYGDLWKLEFWHVDGVKTDLGILSIDPNEVDIVVLDGQHRASAFRVIAGASEESGRGIFPSFYHAVERVEDLDASLPVTVVWFKNSKPKFDPRTVSRRLFVDVNNQSRRVSQSRTILLDEFEVSKSMTRFFYSNIANKYSFDPSVFSLFHAEFDLDVDIESSSRNQLSITNPEIVNDVISWLTLGSNNFNALDKYSVSRERFRSSQWKFSEIFSSEKFGWRDIMVDEDDIDGKRVVLIDSKKSKNFEDEFLLKLYPILFNLYSKFEFWRRNYDACAAIQEEYDGNSMNSTERLVWTEVFCGGQGLYYILKQKNLGSKSSDVPVLVDYFQGVDQIERRFKAKRAEAFSDLEEAQINSAFESSRTKAFQIGLFMALDVYREGQSHLEAIDGFLTAVNSVSHKGWAIILTDVRKATIGAIDPKKWPSYQNLILRVIQSGEKIFYHQDNFEISPDFRFFSKEIESSLTNWRKENDQVDLDDLSIDIVGEGLVKKWAENAKKNIDDLFRKADVPPIDVPDIYSLATRIINSQISKIRG